MRESTVGDPSLRPVAHSDDTIAIAACGAKRVGQWRLVEFLGMVTAFALCAELESRAFVVASERALSSVSQAWGRCAVPGSSSTAASGA